MKKKKGFTYTELLISIVLSSFVVLSIGAASTIGRRSYEKVVEETKIYSDIAYGFKLLQNRIRQADSLTTQPAAGAWVSATLIVNNRWVFGLYRAEGSPTIDFVYLNDKNDETAREVIFSVAETSPVSFTATVSSKAATVRLNGEKKKIRFDISTTVIRRS